MVTGGGGRIRIASQAFIALQVIKSVVSWSFYAPYTHTPLAAAAPRLQCHIFTKEAQKKVEMASHHILNEFLAFE